MKIQIKPGMKFQHNPIQEGNEFKVVEYDFYDDGKPILCAVTDRLIYPLDEVCLDNYMPMVDGKWVNEPCEYEY